MTNKKVFIHSTNIYWASTLLPWEKLMCLYIFQSFKANLDLALTWGLSKVYRRAISSISHWVSQWAQRMDQLLNCLAKKKEQCQLLFLFLSWHSQTIYIHGILMNGSTTINQYVLSFFGGMTTYYVVKSATNFRKSFWLW